MTRLALIAVLLMATIRSASADVTATEIEAPGPSGKLRGTLLAVDGAQTPPVLIIPGSGPTDREGNNTLGIRAQVYRLLAEGLAAEGISSLRIDKRGLFGSAGAIPDADAVKLQDYADDVRTWTAILRKRTDAPCVWLLGHSEGGLVGLLAAQSMPDLCGLILVATPGQKLGEVLRDQWRRSIRNPPDLAQALRAIDSLEAGRHVDTSGMHPILASVFRPAVQGFMIDLLSYDPAVLLRTVSKPVLIVQGERDLQVAETDARRLKAAKPDAELQMIPDANHVLKSTPYDDAMSQRVTYTDPKLPLAPEIVPAIVQFLRSHSPAP